MQKYSSNDRAFVPKIRVDLQGRSPGWAVRPALLAIVALCGIPKFGSKGILGQALAGLILNGLFLTIFVTNFLAARAKASL